MSHKKIYLNKASEDWVVDRFRKEWYQHNKDISANYLFKSNTIWLIAPWTWMKIPRRSLISKEVIATIHHIDMAKFGSKEEKEFNERDSYVDFYHSVSLKTTEQLKELTEKKIYTIPFWTNNKIWFNIDQQEEIREKYNLNGKGFLIGSFQRDTEGFDMVSPKLSKGPDRLIEILKHLEKKKGDIHVVLSGKRRSYLTKQLDLIGIKYSYFEMTKFQNLNELYNCLDLYIVTSRVEGGPQAIMECGLAKVPIVSTNVGLASQILSEESIFEMEHFEDAKPNIEVAYRNSIKYKIPNGFERFRDLFLT